LVRENDLRVIMISGAARYSALGIKIPGNSAGRWNFAGDLVKFFLPTPKMQRST
ncbi:Hypothetical protein FKW44_016353, partial [Caligus rogercresseyi]